MVYGKALDCLSDPTRRRVFERLRSGPKSVGVLARGMPVSRPAVSQHLRARKDAGVAPEKAGDPRRIYYIDPHGLGGLRRWLDSFWDEALLAFEEGIEA